MTFGSQPQRQVLRWVTHTPPGARVLGLITLVVNSGMTFAGTQVLHSNVLGGLALTLLGSLGVGFGLALAFGRYIVTIDATQVWQQWSILLPVRSAQTPLTGFDAVSLVRRVQTAKGPGPGGLHYYTSTSVCLSGPSGLLNVAGSIDDAETEQKARELSTFLRLPVRDERRSAQELIAARKQAFIPLVGRALFLGFVAALVMTVLAAVFVSSTPSRPSRRGRSRRSDVVHAVTVHRA